MRITAHSADEGGTLMNTREKFETIGCFAQRTARNLQEAEEQFNKSCMLCALRNRDDEHCENCSIVREYARTIKKKGGDPETVKRLLSEVES